MPVLSLALAFSALAANGSTLTPLASTTASTTVSSTQTVEEYVRHEFADAPIMIDIARCESRFKQFNQDGSVVKNPRSSAMGVFQIMASIHAAPARANLGFNIYSLEGNADYARYLYERQGTVPWNDSKACWGKSVRNIASNIKL